MRSIVVFAFAALFAGCANAELEQKVKELESGKAQCDKDLKSAEAAKRSLQQKLAQLQQSSKWQCTGCFLRWGDEDPLLRRA